MISEDLGVWRGRMKIWTLTSKFRTTLLENVGKQCIIRQRRRGQSIVTLQLSNVGLSKGVCKKNGNKKTLPPAVEFPGFSS